MKTIEIKATTTVEEIFGAADKNAVLGMINDCNDAGDFTDLKDAVKDHTELLEAIEKQIENADDDKLVPMDVWDAAEAYLTDIQDELVKAEQDDKTPVVDEKDITSQDEEAYFKVTAGKKVYYISKLQEDHTSTEKFQRQVKITTLRPYGKVRNATSSGKKMRSVTMEGSYMEEREDGTIKFHPQPLQSNTRLVSRVFGKAIEKAKFDLFKITEDGHELDVADADVVYNVNFQKTVAKTTTYFETSREGIAAAKSVGVDPTFNQKGERGVWCLHRNTNDADFTGLSGRADKDQVKLLLDNFRRINEARISALEATAVATATAEIEKQKAVAIELAKGEAKGKAETASTQGKLSAVIGSAEKLTELGVNIENVLIAALGGVVNKTNAPTQE
jgi:hypothetical protein